MHFPHLQSTHEGTSIKLTEGFSHRLGRDPILGWAIILIASTVLALLLVLAAVFAYMNVGTELAGGTAALASPAGKNTESQQLEKVLKEYDTKAATRYAVIRAYPGPSDPSF